MEKLPPCFDSPEEADAENDTEAVTMVAPEADLGSDGNSDATMAGEA